MMNFFIKYKFSIETTALLNEKFQHKVCYKKKYNFLKMKDSLSKSIVTRIMRRGNFLKTYKLFKKFYNIILLRKHFKNISYLSNFIYLYKSFFSFRNLDKVLFWKISQVDCMFSLKKQIVKKKIIKNLIFITGIKRILLALNFIKILIVSRQNKRKNHNYKMFTPVYHFIVKNKKSNVEHLKLKIYKLKLLKMQL